MPQYVAMVVNTALCFTLLGVAFIAPIFGLSVQKQSALQVWIGGIVICIAGLVLLQIVLGADFGIDGRTAHAWLADNNPNPGRMAPNTALGFILAGFTLIILQRVNHKITAVLIQITTFLVLLLGSAIRTALNHVYNKSS